MKTSSTGPPGSVLAVAASAGGFEPLRETIQLLPADLDLVALVVMHISRTRPSLLANLLARTSKYEVLEATDGRPLEAGHVFVAPPDHHLTISRDVIRLTRGPRENRSRPAADPLFRSVARWYGPGAIGLVLSGMRNDGAAGLAEIHRSGGLTLVQDPAEAAFSPMPEAAIEADQPMVLRTPEAIVVEIEKAVRANAVRQGPSESGVGEAEVVETDGTVSTGADERSQKGSLTSLKCPDCGGSLWEAEESGVSRYHCRVGHALSTESLDDAQLEELESTLWGAVVALEERADFLRRLRSRVRGPAREQWSDEIDVLERQATKVRALVTDVLSARRA